MRALNKKLEKMGAKVAAMQMVDLFNVSRDVKGVEVVATKLDDASPEMLRTMGDDIKGKKLGFEGGGLRFETMQALGASVVGMNMSDLYQAMQGGIIDGIVMDFDPLISRRYGEEVKHVTLLNITGTAFYVVMNQERYDSLPDDLKAIVDDMSQNYGPNLLEKFWAENVYGSLDKWIKEMGGTVHVLSDEDYARADKLAAVPAQAWFKSLDKAGYRGAELEKTFHQLEAKYFTPWRQSEAYRYVKQQ